jgi:hypothetical protein
METSDASATSRAVYVEESAHFLCDHFLRAHPGERFTLVFGDGGAEMAEKFRAAAPDLRAVAPVDAPAACAEIVLPISLDQRPLRHQAPVLLPDVRPHHALIARLWRAGYRRFTWHGLGGARTLTLPHQLEEFRDRHRGQRCFVVGNGPSLNQIDMGRLKNEITFGSNRCYMGFPDWGYEFSYWGVYDALQIEEYGPEYEQNVPAGPVKFFPWHYWPLLSLENACPVNMDWPRSGPREFSTDPARLIVGYSVTFMLLQVAALMGCDPIYLVGQASRHCEESSTKQSGRSRFRFVVLARIVSGQSRPSGRKTIGRLSPIWPRLLRRRLLAMTGSAWV